MLEEDLNIFFDKVIKGWKEDASSKGQKFPQDFRKEITDDSGKLYGPDYVKYLVFGRGPGKQPPLDNILGWAKKVPLENRSKKNGRFVSYQQLAFAVAKSIAHKGTLIFQGKKPGINFLGVIEEHLPELVKAIAKNEVIEIQTALRSAIK